MHTTTKIVLSVALALIGIVEIPTAFAQQIPAGHAGMDMSGSAMSHDAVVKVGDLALTGAFTKAMLPGQPVGGGYVTIKNNGEADDILFAASSPIAGAVELHEMAMQGEVMRMRKLATGITIPAGKSIKLAPGGMHLMFMKVSEPFKVGAKISVTLEFQKAGKLEICYR